MPTEYLVIGVAFESLEMDGASAPFAAILNGSGAGASWVRPGAGMSLQPRIPLGRVNTFTFSFANRHVVAAGTVSRWTTVDPPPVREIR